MNVLFLIKSNMKTIHSLLLLLFFTPLFTQVPIELKNPSFEILYPAYGMHPCCKAPDGWFGCGRHELNTPDVQPGHFEVDLFPLHSSYYLSMVTRDNDTWESVSQELHSPLLADTKYTFSIALARSEKMLSLSRQKEKLVLYDTPVKLRIWGGREFCGTKELLAESEVVKNTNWVNYDFMLEPSVEHAFITLEAFYKTPTPIAYNGNLLMDYCSSIVPVTEKALITEIQSERKAKLTDFEALKTPDWLAPNKKQAKKKSKDTLVKKAPPEAMKQRIARIQANMDTIATGPVFWTPAFENTSENKYQLEWTANIEEGWKLYSHFNKLFKGAMGVQFIFDEGDHFEFVGNFMESANPEFLYDDFYKTQLTSFKNDAVFQQTLKVHDNTQPITGKVKYVTSNENVLTEPKIFEFIIFPDEQKIIFEKAF